MELNAKNTTAIIGILISTFSYWLFGFTGLKMVLGIIVVFLFSFFLIYDKFNLDFSEKLIFSFFVGVGLFSAMVYLLGRIISVKFSIIIVFIFLVIISYSIKRKKQLNK